MEDFYRMSPLEVAWGWVPGYEAASIARWTQQLPTRQPLEIIESLMLDALQSDPCVIEFSGGRDSSALLAVGVDVAKREGLEYPIPVTRRYPGVPETDEQEWQELVIRHLGIQSWERIRYGEDDDLLGPEAVDSLMRFGLLWPPAAHIKQRTWRTAKGGVFISGEGGDEILGRRRITPLAGLLARNVHPRRWALMATVKAIAPKRIRRRLVLEGKRGLERPWLTHHAQTLLYDKVRDDLVNETLAWNSSLRRQMRRRATTVGMGTLRGLAKVYGVDYRAPLLDGEFIEMLARRGGVLGFPGRTSAMRELFGQLLPKVMLQRRSKAEFTRAVFRSHCRKFVADWDGRGLDPDLVDLESLREVWSTDTPHAGSFPLLQSVFLNKPETAETR